MRIGIDFDNTIVCYDEVFHRVAMEQGLIPADLPISKEHVRGHLRAVGQESAWTEMQGFVYGPRIHEAKPFPGVLEFLRSCRERNVGVRIVSHKTRTPYLGPAYDLHASALGWMEAQGLFAPQGIGLAQTHVHLEPTKKDKLARIGQLACTHFIDDLPEFLGEEGFPAEVQRIHFAPLGGKSDPRFLVCSSWTEIASLLLGTGL